MDIRFITGRDFNTKDWWIYDDKHDKIVCWCDTEKEAQEITDELNKGIARTSVFTLIFIIIQTYYYRKNKPSTFNEINEKFKKELYEDLRKEGYDI